MLLPRQVRHDVPRGRLRAAPHHHTLHNPSPLAPRSTPSLPCPPFAVAVPSLCLCARQRPRPRPRPLARLGGPLKQLLIAHARAHALRSPCYCASVRADAGVLKSDPPLCGASGPCTLPATGLYDTNRHGRSLPCAQWTRPSTGSTMITTPRSSARGCSTRRSACSPTATTRRL